MAGENKKYKKCFVSIRKMLFLVSVSSRANSHTFAGRIWSAAGRHFDTSDLLSRLDCTFKQIDQTDNSAAYSLIRIVFKCLDKTKNDIRLYRVSTVQTGKQRS